MNPEIKALQTASLAALRPLYIKALTAQLEGIGAAPAWAEFRRVLARSLFIADLIGRADAVKDMGLTIDNPAITAEDVRQYAETPPDSLMTGPFWEAINAFRNRVPSLRSVVEAAGKAAKARSFWVTGIEETTALQKIKERIAVNLEGQAAVAVPNPETGEVELHEAGLPAFIQSQREKAIELSDFRLETVYRTNLSTALNEGTNAQLTEPDIQDETALWVLHEVHDKRTRGNPSGLYPYPKYGPHYEMDGFVESPSNPVWAKIGWPGPAGYNCRRSLSPMTWATAIAKGFATKDRQLIQSAIDAHNGKRWGYINRGEYPDPKFSR